MKQYCRYFQSYVKPSKCFFVVAVIKAEGHIAFVRTFDVKLSILEFFVPHETNDQFKFIIERLLQKEYLEHFIELENRYCSLESLQGID